MAMDLTRESSPLRLALFACGTFSSYRENQGKPASIYDFAETGEEDDLDGIKELSMDEKIIRLEMCAKRGLVGSFKPKASAVSPLCGARGDVE